VPQRITKSTATAKPIDASFTSGGNAGDGGPRETVTPEIIGRIFGVEATVQYTDNGIPFPLPQTMRPLEHDPEKWEPVFRKDHAQPKR